MNKEMFLIMGVVFMIMSRDCWSIGGWGKALSLCFAFVSIVLLIIFSRS